MESNTSVKLAVFYGVLAALIWGGWPVVTALGMQHALTPYEVVILRVVLAGPILAPFAFKGDNSLKAWGKALVLTFMAGSTYSIVASSGFLYAPANHGGVMIPGSVMLISTLASHYFLGEHLTTSKSIGIIAILLGLFTLSMGAESGGATSDNSWIGDGLFLAAGVMWGSYTFLLKVWPSDPIVTVARISLISAVSVGGYHAIFQPEITLFELPTSMLVGQILYQSLFSAMIAIIVFSKAVSVLGAGRASILNSLVPVISIILAIIILGEIPTWLEQLGLLAILLGIFMAIKPQRPPVKLKAA